MEFQTFKCKNEHEQKNFLSRKKQYVNWTVRWESTDNVQETTKTSLINQLAKSKPRNEHRNHIIENHEIQAKNFEV